MVACCARAAGYHPGTAQPPHLQDSQTGFVKTGFLKTGFLKTGFLKTGF
jgi:hypothetical protein